MKKLILATTALTTVAGGAVAAITLIGVML